MALKLITPPATLPITVADMKRHLRVDHGDDNDVIEALINQAVSFLDGLSGILGRCLMPQTLELAYDAFPIGRSIRIPLGPVISVTSVIYDDVNGVPQTVSSNDYEIDTYSVDTWVVPLETFSWPATLIAINTVRIQYIAGYAGGAIPPAILGAIKLLVGHWYEHREQTIVGVTIGEIPMAVASLIAPYRYYP